MFVSVETNRLTVVKNLYVSCDPYMRGRMTKHDKPSYVPDIVVGEVTNN